MERTDITSGIRDSIFKALSSAIENNDKESLSVLVQFMNGILMKSIPNNAIKTFEEYVFYPVHSYRLAKNRIEYNKALTPIFKVIAESAPSHAKNIIWLYIGFPRKNARDIEEIKKLNYFYFLAFYAFSDLIFSIIKNGDWELFNHAMDEFDQINDSTQNRNYQLRFQLMELRRNNSKGENNQKIKDLRERNSIENRFETLKRHSLLSLKYWLIFLYERDKINKKTILKYIERLNIPYLDSEDLLEDFVFFRRGAFRGYLGWESWDYIKRPLGKVYSPPNLTWIFSLGFVIDLVRRGGILINQDEPNPEILEQARYFTSDLESILKLINSDFKKWKKILMVESPVVLEQKITSIKEAFSFLKRKHLGERISNIAAFPISPSRVETFTNLIGTTWKANAWVRTLFEKYGNREVITSDDIKLKVIGQRTFFEKGKIMFVGDENHFQHIYGIEQFGGDVGRNEDNVFFNALLKDSNEIITAENVIELLIKLKETLTANEAKTTLFLLKPEFAYHRELVKDNRFVSSSGSESNEGTSIFKIGEFDGVPLYSSYSYLLNNKIIACDFEKAFKMKYRSNPSWFNQELKVSVIEVTNEEAQERLMENPEKWKKGEDGIVLTDDVAIEVVKTSIILEIWSVVDFEVINRSKYSVGIVSSESGFD